MSTKKTKKSKNINITVNINNPHRKKRKRKSTKPKHTVILGNPVQGHIQNFYNNEIPRRETQNQLLEMAYTYNAPELRKNLMIKDQPDQKEQWEDIVQPPSSAITIKPKRKYNKQLKTVTQQLGFADPTSFSYWKSFKTLKSLKDAIKKEHPDVSNELLKTINGKNRDEKVREYLKQIG